MAVPARLARPRGCLLRLCAQHAGAGGSPSLAPSGCVETGGHHPGGGVSARAPHRAHAPPAGPLRTQRAPTPAGRLRFQSTSAVPAWASECACVRASRSGSSSDKARPSAGPGVRGAPGRRAAGCGRWGGAERRRRRQEPTSASRADRDGPLTSSSLPSPPALPLVALSTLRDQAPALRRESASRSSLPEARGALLRAPRVSLPHPGGRRSGALGGHQYYPFPETSRS